MQAIVDDMVGLTEEDWTILCAIPIGYSHVMGRAFSRSFTPGSVTRITHHVASLCPANSWRVIVQVFGNPCGEVPIYARIKGDREAFERDLLLLKIALV